MSYAKVQFTATEIESVSDASVSGDMMNQRTRLALRDESTSVELVGTRDELRALLARMAEVIR